MDRLEQELKLALERKAPRDGFSERAIAAASARRVIAFPAPRWAMTAAAALVVCAGGGLAYRQHQGELAKEQVMTAMRLTAGKLHQIQAHVQEVAR